jgi:hypothetical protein
MIRTVANLRFDPTRVETHVLLARANLNRKPAGPKVIDSARRAGLASANCRAP